MKIKWTLEEVNSLFKKPLINLIYTAQNIHRKYFNPSEIQISTLLSIKTGLCPEDCQYCAQSSRYKTELKSEKLLNIKKVIAKAQHAKNSGSNRFCMGAAWKNPKTKDMPYLIKIIKKIKNMGMETCMTLGSINIEQAKQLFDAGLDFYNHNLDTSPEMYKKIITTRTYEERLNTLKIVSKSGIKVCSGGILGLGENTIDRAKLLLELSNLKKVPDSVPINMLVKIPGTPMENNAKIHDFDFIKTIAITRIMMPKSYIRLSAGREHMHDTMQAMCFLAGANSIFYGCKLLTTTNSSQEKDKKLLKKLGIYSKNAFLNYANNEKILNLNNNKNYYNAAIN